MTEIEKRLTEIREILNSVGLSVIDANHAYEDQLRDRFAVAAMQGMLSRDDWGGPILAKEAYGYADAMMKAREGKRCR